MPKSIHERVRAIVERREAREQRAAQRKAARAHAAAVNRLFATEERRIARDRQQAEIDEFFGDPL